MFGWILRRGTPREGSPASTGNDGDRIGHVPATRSRPPRAIAVPSLASATRDYASAVEGAYLGRLSDLDTVALYAAMGSEIWAWQYARRLTGQAPWRASPTRAEAHERARAIRLLSDDIGTWERAEAEYAAERGRAVLYGKPPPAPLEVPPAVRAMIEARRQAAADRATRRRVRAEGGSSGPPIIPGDVIPHPTPTVGPA